MYFIEKALEYIFLPSCGICGKLGEGDLCKKCGKDLEKYLINAKEKVLIDLMENDFNKDINYDIINKFHIFRYEDVIRKLIIQYKFNDKSYLYKMFCEFILKDKKAFDFIKSYDIIIPVPIHKKRMKKRGYNQSELIVKELAKRVKIEPGIKILVKTINNKPQSTLSGKLRKENTKNVYKLIDQEKINNKKILLFDDIYTTGATANECILELKKAEPKKIGIITLAKD